MKKHTLSLAISALLLAVAGNAAACTFSWRHFGDDAVDKRIKEQIGAAVTDAYCSKYGKSAEIVVITDNYTTSTTALGHATVGLRKKGSDKMVRTRRSSFRLKDGNFVVAVGYDLAAQAAIDAVMDLMSDLDAYKPE